MQAFHTPEQVADEIAAPLQDTKYQSVCDVLNVIAMLAYRFWIAIAKRGDNPVVHHLWVYRAGFNAAARIGTDLSFMLQLLTASLLHDIVDKSGKLVSAITPCTN